MNILEVINMFGSCWECTTEVVQVTFVAFALVQKASQLPDLPNFSLQCFWKDSQSFLN